MEKILRVKNVTKIYGNGSAVTKALDGIAFDVEKGEFMAVMGASGSGKSTLLNVISTIDRASAGEIYIDGRNICEAPERELARFRRDRLGFIFQDYNLLDALTVEENIALPLDLMRKPHGETERELSRVAKALGIEKELKKFPYELSGGQRQRTACARALITEPSLILADEPTGALDSKNSTLLMNTFELMNKGFGATVLMVTHDANVGSYARRVLFLKDGRVFGEAFRGERTRGEFYAEIVATVSALGGGRNAD